MEVYSTTTGQKRTMGPVDYVVFGSLFGISIGIGIYHAIKDRHNTNPEEFHFGGRKMHVLPVTFSMTATFLSALTLLGNPVEIYVYDTMYLWLCVSMLFAMGASALIFIPVFYRLKLQSVFEYLEMRYGKPVKYITCLGFLFEEIFLNAFVLAMPALALETVTGLSLWTSTITVGAVGTLYTMLGGMKTVLWADTVQCFVMIGGMVIVLIQGSIATGGFGKAWELAEENDRVRFIDFNPHPHERHTIWSLVVGGTFLWAYYYGVNQAQIQRACTLPTLRKAKMVFWLNLPGMVIIHTLSCLCGVVMFAFYIHCDPKEFGIIERSDQLLPLFVMDILGSVPGIPGLFSACVFSGSLSTFSSALNAFSLILDADFIKPFCCKTVANKRETLLSKVLVVIGGVGCIGLALLVSQASSSLLLEMAITTLSLTCGPMVGTFLSGLLLPWTNTRGALVGYIASFLFVSWIAVGKTLNGITYPVSEVSIFECVWNNTKYNSSSTIDYAISVSDSYNVSTSVYSTPPTPNSDPALFGLYRLSYIWYYPIGTCTTVLVSLTVSFLTGPNDPTTIDSDLLCPIFDVLFPCLPEKVRKPLRFGVVYKKADEEARSSVDENDEENSLDVFQENQDGQEGDAMLTQIQPNDGNLHLESVLES